MATKHQSLQIFVILFLLFSCLSINIKAQNKKDDGKVITFSKRLPDITLQNVDGEPVKVARFGENGKVTILKFWASWALSCIRDLENTAQSCKSWSGDLDVEIVSVSVDDLRNTDKVKEVAQEYEWDFPILIDTSDLLLKTLNVKDDVLPYTVIVDHKGRVIYEGMGDEKYNDEATLREMVKEARSTLPVVSIEELRREVAASREGYNYKRKSGDQNLTASAPKPWVNQSINSKKTKLPTSTKTPTPKPKPVVSKPKSPVKRPIVTTPTKLASLNSKVKDTPPPISIQPKKTTKTEIALNGGIKPPTKKENILELPAKTTTLPEEKEIVSEEPKLSESLTKVDLITNENGRPVSLDNRRIKVSKHIPIKNKKVTLTVWDEEYQDGDIISLSLNGEWILQNYSLKREQKNIFINLNDDNNFLILYAHNEGLRPPNTAAIRIDDGINQRSIRMSSNMSNCDAVNLMCKTVE